MEFLGEKLDHDRVDVDIHSIDDSVDKPVLPPAPVTGNVGGAVGGSWIITGFYLQLYLVQVLRKKFPLLTSVCTWTANKTTLNNQIKTTGILQQLH
jgi:hypothetical protein